MLAPHGEVNTNKQGIYLTAKQKLNAAHFGGSIIVGGMLGALTQSGFVFFATTAIILILSVYDGSIRLK